MAEDTQAYQHLCGTVAAGNKVALLVITGLGAAQAQTVTRSDAQTLPTTSEVSESGQMGLQDGPD